MTKAMPSPKAKSALNSRPPIASARSRGDGASRAPGALARSRGDGASRGVAVGKSTAPGQMKQRPVPSRFGNPGLGRVTAKGAAGNPLQGAANFAGAMGGIGKGIGNAVGGAVGGAANAVGGFVGNRNSLASGQTQSPVSRAMSSQSQNALKNALKK